MPILLELHNDHFDIEEQVSVVSYVTAHTEYLRYNKYTDASSTHLSYFESELQTPKNNIKVQDLSFKHPQNNKDELREIVEEYSGKSFFSLYKNLLITNVIDNEGIPLFYKHKTRFRSEPQIRIVNENENENVTGSHKYIDGYFFNNYKNDYNYEQNSYQLIFLTGIDIDGNSVSELLNNESAIEELGWRDINLGIASGLDILDNDSGIAKINSYVKTQTGNGYQYDVIIVENFCESEKQNKIYVKYLNSNSIYLKKPNNINQENSWFLSINSGFFFTNKKYFVPEYEYQNFNPEYGIIKNYDSECYILNKYNNGSILKTLKENLLLDKEVGLNITVKLLNSNEEILRVFTSDESLYGLEYSENILYEEGIESIDSINGVIQLSQDVYADPNRGFEEEIKIRADFYSKTSDYIYSKLDINPTFNPEILNHKYYFYLKPNMDFGNSVFWIKLNYKNEIKDLNDRKLWEPGNKEDLLDLSFEQFKETYIYGYQNNFQFLELGEVLYDETAYLDEALVLDIRDNTPINEETFNDYLYRQHKVLQSELGYGFEGQVYQSNNIIYVTLPKDLLIQYGGQYQKEELYELLKLKTSPGLEILINFEDKKPELKIDALTNAEIDLQEDLNRNEIFLKISLEGLGMYKIYRFNALNNFNIEDESQIIASINVSIDNFEDHQDNLIKYTDSNLDYDTEYFYKVIYEDMYISDTLSFRTRKGN